jgi:crossover junction endodeoxyribonuclease RuvC
MRVLGVDPGAGGALAMYDTDLEALVIADMPTMPVRTGKTTRRQISEGVLVATLRNWQPHEAYLERVHSMPGQGVTSAFTFGQSYGLIRGILTGLTIPWHLVTPQEWKRYFRLGPDKREARLIAARLLPANASSFARVKDDGRAEAALLALFGVKQSCDP